MRFPAIIAALAIGFAAVGVAAAPVAAQGFGGNSGASGGGGGAAASGGGGGGGGGFRGGGGGGGKAFGGGGVPGGGFARGGGGFAAPRSVAPSRAFVPRTFSQPRVATPRFSGQTFGPGTKPAMRFGGPTPRYRGPALRPRARVAGGFAPHFLHNAHRRFWQGRWLWFGAPAIGYINDPCWRRLWTPQWGWGWYYVCGYPDDGYPYDY